ncbi:hypothetical protein SK128_014763, partial [Halocaridina rubra]
MLDGSSGETFSTSYYRSHHPEDEEEEEEKKSRKKRRRRRRRRCNSRRVRSYSLESLNCCCCCCCCCLLHDLRAHLKENYYTPPVVEGIVTSPTPPYSQFHSSLYTLKSSIYPPSRSLAPLPASLGPPSSIQPPSLSASSTLSFPLKFITTTILDWASHLGGLKNRSANKNLEDTVLSRSCQCVKRKENVFHVEAVTNDEFSNGASSPKADTRLLCTSQHPDGLGLHQKVSKAAQNSSMRSRDAENNVTDAVPNKNSRKHLRSRLEFEEDRIPIASQPKKTQLLLTHSENFSDSLTLTQKVSEENKSVVLSNGATTAVKRNDKMLDSITRGISGENSEKENTRRGITKRRKTKTEKNSLFGKQNNSNSIYSMNKIFSIHQFFWFSLLIIASVLAPAECGNPDAKRLYDDLLSNYNKLVRPVVNVTDVLTVRIKLKLSQLIDV